MGFILRPARPEDAAGILNTHYHAVHESARPFYTAEICACWSPPLSPERIAHYRDHTLEQEFTLVAEQNKAIMGFGVVECDNAYLKAVYVHPRFAAQGVGRALLGALEAEAREQGVETLKLKASLNARDFYLSQGYTLREHGQHRLNGGLEMACVHMQKFLH